MYFCMNRMVLSRINADPAATLHSVVFKFSDFGVNRNSLDLTFGDISVNLIIANPCGYSISDKVSLTNLVKPWHNRHKFVEGQHTCPRASGSNRTNCLHSVHLFNCLPRHTASLNPFSEVNGFFATGLIRTILNRGQASELLG